MYHAFVSRLAIVLVCIAMLRLQRPLQAAAPHVKQDCVSDAVTAEFFLSPPLPIVLQRHDYFSGRLRVYLRPDGSVRDVRFEQHFDYATFFDSVAVKTVRRWTFPPDRKCDIVTIPLTFHIRKAM
jgi:hypothetical protein